MHFTIPSRALGAALLLSAALVLGGSPAHGQARKSSNELSRNNAQVLAAFRDVAAAARKSAARVLCNGRPAALGTVVGADGWILTKASELKGSPVVKLADGRELPARLVGVEEAFDLAMLKVEARGLTPVVWRDSKEAPVGSWVATVATDEQPLAAGVVSVAARKGVIHPTPPPGSGYLGIVLEAAEGGVKILDVAAGSPAEKAGLKVNDVVLAVGGKDVKEIDALTGEISLRKPGETVTLRLRRAGEVKEIKAALGKRPADQQARGDLQNSMGGRRSERRYGFPVFLQHDTVLEPEQCGGPLVDLDGKAVGINIARSGRTDSYAIPSEEVRPLLADLKSGKLAPKPTVAAKSPAQEKFEEAKAAVTRAEAEAAAADKKLAEAREALKKAEADLKKEPEKKGQD